MRFSKTGRSVYISHLDLLHTMQRAFSRAGYELCYSQGFNPHPCISIALPLGVGTSSICEIMDFSLKNDDIDISRLNEKLPEGITALDIYEPDKKIREIKYLKVSANLRFENDIYPDLNTFFARDSIKVSKKSKSGMTTIDIKPLILEINIEGNNLSAIVSAQNPTLNPELLIDAVKQLEPTLAPSFALINREEIYDENMKVFR